jgi:dienelactone hydrolase|tara:strand:+ start:4469 stop:6499 length:2031 start_codon:yes stop_codon:yes gene_type:complete
MLKRLSVFTAELRVLCAALILSVSVSASDAPSRFLDESFIKSISERSDIWTTRISPNGKLLALGFLSTEKKNGKRRQGVHILDTRTFKTVNTIGFKDGSDISRVVWLTSKKILINIRKDSKKSESGKNLLRYYVMDFTGKNKFEGFGSFEGRYSENEIITSVFNYSSRRVDYFIDRIDRKPGRPSVLERQNCSGLKAYTKKCSSKEFETLPLLGQALFSRSEDGLYRKEMRFAYGIDDNSRGRFYYRGPGAAAWIEKESPFRKELIGYGATPLDVLANGNLLVSAALPGESIKSLFEWNPETDEVLRVFQDATADPGRRFSHRGHLIAVETETNYPEVHMLDRNHELAAILGAIMKSFPNYGIGRVSFSDDFKKVVFSVYSGSEPSMAYFFDRATGQVQLIAKALNQVDRSLLAETEAVTIKARDGVPLHGYITFPKTGESNNPLVIIPHGGPRARDTWGFDSETQVLAHHGYMVMKINFRGSDGYGLDFMHMGDGEWGRKTQYDIIDSVRWAINQGYADPEKIAIVGASFGGYSALQSPILEPDLFKAAVGYVGVYSLPMLYTKGDIGGNTGNYRFQRGGSIYLDETLGSDKAEQIRQSPVVNIRRLKAPVLIVHGKDDDRAPIEHAELLMKAMDEAGKSYETLIRDKEGHGFFSEDNRKDYFTLLVRFLNKHLE